MGGRRSSAAFPLVAAMSPTFPACRAGHGAAAAGPTCGVSRCVTGHTTGAFDIVPSRRAHRPAWNAADSNVRLRKIAAGVPRKEGNRKGEESQVRQESRQTFPQAEFGERDFFARLLQPVEVGWRGLQGRAAHRRRWFLLPSQNAPLATRKGIAGEEMPPGLTRIQMPTQRQAEPTTARSEPLPDYDTSPARSAMNRSGAVTNRKDGDRLMAEITSPRTG
ncbi:unnamed protein product [Tuwongella immobilis]|uniref:Uncharacterized protein n=1 Tax=Tuwongella immobilis TaxID=692036 RepID=A0A6C2YHM1_9BACT|nr:unnamed protein product [Tuwongella immobilis]VTR96936.1 unnamed protein product [Tuwongella immobilis]